MRIPPPCSAQDLLILLLVRAPLPDVASQVVQPKVIRGEAGHRGRLCESVVVGLDDVPAPVRRPGSVPLSVSQIAVVPGRSGGRPASAPRPHLEALLALRGRRSRLLANAN